MDTPTPRIIMSRRWVLWKFICARMALASIVRPRLRVLRELDVVGGCMVGLGVIASIGVATILSSLVAFLSTARFETCLVEAMATRFFWAAIMNALDP